MSTQKTPYQIGAEVTAVCDRAAKLGYYVSCDENNSLQLYAPMHGFDTPESIRDFLNGVERSRARQRRG